MIKTNLSKKANRRFRYLKITLLFAVVTNRRLTLLLLLLPALAGAPGCATKPKSEEPAAVSEAKAPPGPPKAITKPQPPRNMPNFAAPPPSYDPLFGGDHAPVFGPDRLKIQAICCPDHANPNRRFDPLVE